MDHTDFNELIDHIKMLCQVIVAQHEQIVKLSPEKDFGTYEEYASRQHMEPVYNFLRDCERD